ncbi:YgjP-like metallopeptidase domain-containing protein [Streptomyces sp. NPDC059564]|uniref:YgjP-like metallopeptidase domain-containing protein n=1 Tax=Streptomyces sp. NPDC059564 TaxID=3346865 RepID=UPI0036C865F8
MAYIHERNITANDVGITIKTSNRTSLELDVASTGNIIVRGPHTTTDEEARDLVTRRRRWIYRQLTHLCETTLENPMKVIEDGEQFPLFGRPHTLRIIRRDPGASPANAYTHPDLGPIIDLHQHAATNQDDARRTLITFYSNATRTWLENHGHQITQLTTNPDTPLTVSWRARTRWITRHKNGALTLHWALGQLPTRLLREFLHRTLGLHSIADGKELDHYLKNLWLGRLQLTPDPEAPTNPKNSDTCPKCHAHPGNLHTNWCDLARCAFTGFQRSGCQHPSTICLTLWTGRWPGEEECEEYGFYYQPVDGFREPCNADDEGAEPDLNRLYTECVWDPGQQRMILRV